MAERANGGTSIVDATSRATTRPAASSSRTRSVRAIGTTAASRRRRASSRAIVEANGRTTSARGLAHEVAQFRNQELFHRESDGGLRSRQRDDDAAGDKAGAGAAQHGRRADFLITEHSKQLAEPVEP